MKVHSPQALTFIQPKPSVSQRPTKSEPIETSDQIDCDLARPQASRALDRSLAILAAHQVRQVATSLSGLPAASLLFHGTPEAFDRLEARPNQRIGRQGQVEWSGTAIFAAMDPRVALHYTAKRSPEISTGVSLRSYTAPDQPLHISLHGGKNLEDALNQAYGDPAQPESCLGYIHLLKASQFVHEPGMGCMEKITRDSSADLGQMVVDRRAALQDLQAQNLIKLSWFPGTSE